MRLKIFLTFLAALWTAPAVAAQAQEAAGTIIVPPPVPPAPVASPPRPQVEKIGLDVVIDGQKAACVLQYVLYNPADRPLEVDFLAPLPEGGAVTGLTLMDGQAELPGRIYGRDEAWEVYREIVSKLKDPALLEYAGRDTYRARVFPLPAKGRRTLELRFDYLAPKSDGRASFGFPLAGPLTAGRQPEVEAHLTVKAVPGLANLYSPLAGMKIDHQPGQDALVTFTSEKAPVPNHFRLFFQTGSGPMGGLVLSHRPDPGDDGFFLFLAEPALDPAAKIEAAKKVIFVLDKSGSMSGPKFEQAKGALRFILERLDARDLFNLVDYNDRVSAWKPEAVDMSPGNRRSALAYVDHLRAGGATDIEAALETSFSLAGDPGQPAYLVFLTDGQPTSGEENELKLAELAQKANPKDAARLFAFGLGFDVNSRLLDRLSGQAGGASVFVDPDEDLEAKVSAFFSRLTAPALTRPALTADRALNRLLPETCPDLFVGQQLALVGRYPVGGAATLTLGGRQGEAEKVFKFTVDLAEGPNPDGQFIAGLWAQRRIGQLIDRIDLAGGKPNPELVAELVALSKKYGILTPYTSFLALENQDITREADLAPLAAENLAAIGETVGKSANYQRAVKGEMRAAVQAQAPKAAAAVQAEAEALAQLDQAVARSGEGRLYPPRQWAGQTFFFKDGQWRAESLDEAALRDPRVIRQLSEDYFALARKLGPEEMVWLSQPEPVAFQNDGVTYLIEPAS